MQFSIICTLENINKESRLVKADTYRLRLCDKPPIDQRLGIIGVGAGEENVVRRRGTDVAVIGLIESSSFNDSNRD